MAKKRLNITEEWRQSSDVRRAAILRIIYTLLVVAFLPLLLNTFPGLARFMLPAIVPALTILLQTSIVPLISLETAVQAEQPVNGSPNLRNLRSLFAGIDSYKSPEHWKRPFYRFSLYTLVAIRYFLGCVFAIFFAPLILIETLVFGRNSSSLVPQQDNRTG